MTPGPDNPEPDRPEDDQAEPASSTTVDDDDGGDRGLAEAAVGGAMDEPDIRTRDLTHISAVVVFVIALCYGLYYLWTAEFGLHSQQAHRGLYWGFAAVLVFLLFPIAKSEKLRSARRIPFYDLGLAIIAAGLAGYYVFNYPNIVARGGRLTDLEYVLSIAAVLVSLEVTRRVVGWTLSIIGILAIVYTFFGPHMPGLLAHGGYDAERFLSTMYTSYNGIFGPIAAIFATFVFIFILFGSFLQKSGAGQFFIDLPFALAGDKRGGPAKVAVAVSALMGSVNGSPVANVMTTGSLTIPLMRRTGYSKEFSGGVEAAASVGGQLLPPVMGAGAFLIAEFTRTPYTHIVLVSIVPAIMYFLTVYWLVDFRALKRNLVGLPKSELPDTKTVLKQGWYFLIPIVLLLVLILQRFSPAFAGFWAIVSVVVIGVLVPYNGRRMNLRDLADAVVSGSIASLTVGGIVGTIGIVVGVVNLTGLGLRFSSVIVDLSAGNLLLALVLVTLVSWLLGAGLTVTSSYIMVAILAAPALTELGVSLLAAHLIIFWVSQDANVTPPICLAAFAAASISGGSPMRTGVEAWKLARGLYIVPLLMAYTALVDGPFVEAIPVVLSAVVGLYALAAGISGYLRRETVWWEQGLLLVGGGLMIAPGMLTNVIGLAVAVAAYVVQRARPNVGGRPPSVATA